MRLGPAGGPGDGASLPGVSSGIDGEKGGERCSMRQAAGGLQPKLLAGGGPEHGAGRCLPKQGLCMQPDEACCKQANMCACGPGSQPHLEPGRLLLRAQLSAQLVGGCRARALLVAVAQLLQRPRQQPADCRVGQDGGQQEER